MSDAERISVTVQRRLKLRIQAMADDEHRSLSEMTRYLLWAAIFTREVARDARDEREKDNV